MSSEVFNAYATLGGLISLIPVQLSAMLLTRRFPNAYAGSRFKLAGPLLYLLPVIGILVALGAIATVVLELTSAVALVATVYGCWPVLAM